MVNHAQDFVAVKKYEILQFSLIPSRQAPVTLSTGRDSSSSVAMEPRCHLLECGLTLPGVAARAANEI